jgi:hypothetical protein
LKFYGKAKAKWVEGTSEDEQQFEGIEVYLNEKFVLLENRSDLPEGLHVFKFQVQLPSKIPASLHYKHGKIEYSAETVLQVPWKFDKDSKVLFNVIRKDNFSSDVKLSAPRSLEHEISTRNIFSWNSKPLLAKILIPCSVFTPGSIIPITIHLENRSQTNISNIHIKLEQIIKFNRYNLKKF